MVDDSENGEGELEVDIYAMCLVLLERGRKALSQSNWDQAGKLFGGALQIAEKLPSDVAKGLLPLALLCRSLLEQRSENQAESKALRKRAIPLLGDVVLGEQSIPFHNLMSLTLMDLEEYRRAIPFCEQGVQQLVDKNEPLAASDLLAREGLCYNRCGLGEQAAVPLRAAVKILRSHPGDPRLASTLISLGNALRKSAPEEAERLFKEAAEIHEAKGQFESATPAWVNLGMLCSRQGRHQEALAWYGQALRVREGTPGTPPERLGLLLNNMANARRRMGDFAEALQLVDRALSLLKKDDSRMLAHAYGTRGQILHDAGRHEQALVWLQKSYAERRKSSSPDLDALAEILGDEIDSLRSLGRADGAAAAEKRLAALKKEKAAAPQANAAMGEIREQAPASVMVELAVGTRPGSRFQPRDAELVAEQIGTILARQNAGKYGGRAMIPESTTLWFHGEDSEAMFAAMEQYLSDHAVCAGAVITIRQGQRVREMVIPQLTN